MFPTSSQTLSLGSTDISSDMEKDLPNLSNRSMVLLRDILESLPNLDSRVGGAILSILRLTEFLDAALTVSKSDEEISDADRYLIVKSVENAKDIDRFATFIYDNLPNDQDKGIYSQVNQLIEQTCEKRNIILSYYQTISTLDDTNTVTNSNNEIPFFNEKISQNYSTIISEYEAIKEKGGMPGEGLYKSLLQTIAQKSKIESSSSDNEYESRQQRHNELFRLYLVFQEMRTAGIQPDAATYNTLIHACTGAGDLEKAFEAIQEMQADGLAPGIIVIIIKSYYCHNNNYYYYYYYYYYNYYYIRCYNLYKSNKSMWYIVRPQGGGSFGGDIRYHAAKDQPLFNVHRTE